MTVTFPAFVLYIFLLPYKNDTNNINRDKKDIRNSEPGQQRKNIPGAQGIDKTYAVSWIFSINTNQ